MKKFASILVLSTLGCVGTLAPCLTVRAAVVFLGEGAIPGDALDHSNLSQKLEDGVSTNDQVGGLGSAITYGGSGDVYFAAPDRGPAAGATSYVNRIYRLEIKLTKLEPNRYRVEPSLQDTLLMRTEDGRLFTGKASAFDATNSPNGLRLDPEGLRISACGKTAYLCDEYGPHLYEVDLRSGKRLRTLPVPRKFLVDFPSTSHQEERDKNLSGRQTNRGFEGLAITPDGNRLLAVIQQPLLQDGALDADKKPFGLNCRIVEVDLKTGAVREFVYPMEMKTNGLSEMLAINDHEFLVIEHDAKAAPETSFKKIFRIDLADASDVRAVKALTANGAAVTDGSDPTQIKPVRKTLFLDLLTAGIPNMPEKVEGLTFGPDLEDGRHLLIASVDNDFSREHPNRFWAFAVDPIDLPGYQSQLSLSRQNSACADPHSRNGKSAWKAGTGSRRHKAVNRLAAH